MSRAARVLMALALGLAAGVAAGGGGSARLDSAQALAGAVGGIWLDALRVTILPLVFSLVVTGIASAARTGRAGGVAGRALLVFLSMLVFAAFVSALLVPWLLQAWTPELGALDALRATLGSAPPAAPPPPTQWIRALIPTNIVAAAAADAIVPVVLFALAFGFAASRLPEEKAAPLIGFFELVAETMLVIVGWVLWLAPVGVFALAFIVGSHLGGEAAAALVHYIGVQIALSLVMIVSMYVLAATRGKVAPWTFARAMAPAQAVAASTQSSLASLPPMLASAERLGVSQSTAGVVLPLAVAVFKLSATTSIMIATLTLAKLSGADVGPVQLVVVGLFAVLGTLTFVGLPGQVSFIAAVTPPALAIGVPIELMPLLLAVDTIPDIFHTVANVTADVTAAVVVDPADALQSEESQPLAADPAVQHERGDDGEARGEPQPDP